MSSLTLKTEEVVVFSKEDEDIILNCTYQNNTDERISEADIRWRIREKNVFKDVAIFSPPGRIAPFIESEMEDLYKNRTKLIGPTTSQLSAVMIINNPVCTDEGTYQCWIQYTIGNSVNIKYNQNVTTFVQFNGKYINISLHHIKYTYCL